MKLRYTLVAVLLVLLVAMLPAAHAADGNPNYVLNCQGFESVGGELALNRDNTGALSEAFVISAIDGAGNKIYEADYDVFFVGTSVTVEPGAGDSWTRSPRYNPLILQVVSPAGNGQEEQIIAEVIGSCNQLPHFAAINFLAALRADAIRQLTGEAFVLQPADGETSEPVQLNEIPPRPVNPPGLPQVLPGHAVVNTDNLSLRSGDGPRYEILGVIDGGTELVVLGRNDDRSWWYVQVGGMRGWVSSEFLALRGDLTGVPEVPVTGNLTQPSLYVGFTGNPVYIEPLPGTATLCAIPGNISYALVGRTSSANWYEIEVTCEGELATTAWIPAELGIVRNPAGLRIPVTYP